MGSSRPLVCSTAFVLVILSSASTDEPIFQQHDVTFDLEKITQEMQHPDSFTMQKEVDVLELFTPEELERLTVSAPEQLDTLSERGGSRPGVLTPRKRRPYFGPRSLGGPPMRKYSVQFPLGRPTSENLQAICLHGDRRPRYPHSYFPNSGFGQQKRMASAVNKAESWFSTCCKGNQTWEREVMLCCATQAWKLSVKSFCEENSSVKDRQYGCCSQQGSDRLNCFHKNAPNPNYEPTEEVPVPPPPSVGNFEFDPNTCQRTVITTYSVRGLKSTPKKIDISFPPGRPTADVIESLCQNQKLRPLYDIKCLPGLGYEWLAHQAKTINRIENGFKQCCKKKRDVLNCADQMWRQELKRFCLGENGNQVDFSCCSVDGGNARYSCFQNISSDPNYNMTLATEKLSLHNICDTHKIIKKKFPVGFPLKSLVIECCPPMSEQDRTHCLLEKLVLISENQCLSRKNRTSDIYYCCHVPSQTPQYLSQRLVDAITKATNFLRQKKKKKCPLS